jgi:hypothetical protein
VEGRLLQDRYLCSDLATGSFHHSELLGVAHRQLRQTVGRRSRLPRKRSVQVCSEVPVLYLQSWSQERRWNCRFYEFARSGKDQSVDMEMGL